MAISGTSVVLYVGTNAVGSQRDLKRDETTEEIDVSSKTGRAKRVLPGRYSSSLTLDALYVPTDTAYQALKEAMRDGDDVTVTIYEDGVATETASAIITSLSESFPDQDASVVSVGLTIDGEWVEVGT